MKITKEDIQNFATEDEKKALAEIKTDWRNRVAGVRNDVEKYSGYAPEHLKRQMEALKLDIEKAKKKIISHHKRHGAHEMGVGSWVDKLVGSLEDKWRMNDLVYGGYPIERQMASLLKDFWTWAVNYEGQEDLPGPNSLRKESVQLTEKWVARLSEVYSDFEEFKDYDEIYNLAERLGFDSAEDAWLSNPKITGGVNPEDYKALDRGNARKVKESIQLAERRRGYVELYVKQKKILDRFIADHYHDIKRGGLWFNIDDWPELYDEVSAVRETETLWSDINRYVSDKLMDMPWKNRHPWGDSVDPSLNNEDKEALLEANNYDERTTLKESVADQRAEEFINASEHDLDIWEEMVSGMTPEERKEAAFEFKSAIRGMVWYRSKWKPKGHRLASFMGDEHNKYWDEIKNRRLLYTRYLNRLKKYLKEDKPDFAGAVDKDRIKNLSNDEVDMISKMFK